jgi:hypothetical protein
MYGFPSDFPAADFLQRRLEAVTYAENLVRLDFGDRVSITALSPFSYDLGEGQRVEDMPARETTLISLIGESVVAAAVVNSTELRLEIGRAKVKFEDRSQQYESFTFSINGIEYVV